MPSIIEKRFLERLKGHMRDFADESLRTPADRTDFGFGQVCGTYQGLLLAEQLFKEVIGEEDDQP